MTADDFDFPPDKYSVQEKTKTDFAEKKTVSAASEKQYVDTLTSLSDAAVRTARNVSYSLGILTDNLEEKVQKIKLLSSQAVYAVQEISLNTKVKLIAFGAAMFLSGVLLTCGIYNAFLTNIMNSYLHKTIEKLAEKPVRQAEIEAEKIIRNANIKADGMLKNARSYNMSEGKNEKKNNTQAD